MQPAVFSALLIPESTLLSAPGGYGKSTLVLRGRQEMQRDWLNVSLAQAEAVDEAVMTVLLRRITHGMWSHIEIKPRSLADLQTRATAARYFLKRFSEVDVDYLLACLVDDFPADAETIEAFRAVEVRELFSPTASDAQRLSILCDCIEKLGMKGVVIWIDLATELKQLSPLFVRILEDLFDSLHLMRRRALHIKCLAPPSVCRHLQRGRGLETLSVKRLELQWRTDELVELVNGRLQLASDKRLHSLAQLVDPQACIALLDEFSDVTSPAEWLILARLVVEKANASGEIPLAEAAWLGVQRAYCAERVQIRLDSEGSFWRGKQLLADLNPKKRAIYPLVRFLYEHPGVHRTYKLIRELDIDETNLNTIISRARKEHLEPFLATDVDGEDAWIYLVTDQGGGYALLHTDRSP